MAKDSGIVPLLLIGGLVVGGYFLLTSGGLDDIIPKGETPEAGAEEGAEEGAETAEGEGGDEDVVPVKGGSSKDSKPKSSKPKPKSTPKPKPRLNSPKPAPKPKPVKACPRSKFRATNGKCKTIPHCTGSQYTGSYDRTTGKCIRKTVMVTARPRSRYTYNLLLAHMARPIFINSGAPV